MPCACGLSPTAGRSWRESVRTMSASACASPASLLAPDTPCRSRNRAACSGFTGNTRYPAATSAVTHGPRSVSIPTTTCASSRSSPSGRAQSPGDESAHLSAATRHRVCRTGDPAVPIRRRLAWRRRRRLAGNIADVGLARAQGRRPREASGSLMILVHEVGCRGAGMTPQEIAEAGPGLLDVTAEMLGGLPTCTKSHARMPGAWAFRNCRHVGDARRGAGPSPARSDRSIFCRHGDGARPAECPGLLPGAAAGNRAAALPGQRTRRGQPSPAAGGQPDAAAPRPRAGGPRSRRP
jgi:hypothetical protein